SGGAAVGSRTVIRATAHLLLVRRSYASSLIPMSGNARRLRRMRAEGGAGGIVLGEGPVWVPDGTPGGPSLVVTSVAASALYRIPPEGGRAVKLAATGGGAK